MLHDFCTFGKLPKDLMSLGHSLDVELDAQALYDMLLIMVLPKFNPQWWQPLNFAIECIQF